MNKTVLISGASVAGPALAYWLQRYGYQPTVVERAPAPRDGGYAVDFRGASMTVLERMGILDEVRAQATNMGPMEYVDERGKKLAEVMPEALSGELEILRGDLVKVLYDLTRDRVEYLFDDSITALEQDEDGVTVAFESGGTRRFDLVVGADGLHSNVRALAFGAESAYRKDLGYYATIFTTANHLGLSYKGRFLNTPGRVVGMYPARQNTEAKALLYWESEPVSYDRRDVGQQQQLVADAYADLGWEVPVLLKSLPEAPDFYFDSVSQIVMPSYSTGRVVLVGDAGYCASPLSGMGTSLAVVGAYVLAGELKRAEGNHRDAFAAYDQAMKEFVEACQKQGRAGGKWFVPSTKWFIKFRNLQLRMLPYLPWRKVIEEMPLKVGNVIKLQQY